MNNDELLKMMPIDEDNHAITRVNEKCINCGMCKKICPLSDKVVNDPSKCIGCGKCIISCPMGAIIPKYEYHEVLNEIENSKKCVVAVLAPGVKVSIGEGFNLEYGMDVEKKIIGALKQIGFNYVFDVSYGADLTVLEESTELLERIKSNKNLPLFTSCCPSFVKTIKDNYKDYIDNLSTCKSPIAMLTSVIKKYFSKEKNINEKDIVTVAITPCTSKKEEKLLKNLNNTCDYVITASESVLMFKELEIDFKNIEEKEYDKMFDSSGSGNIFGKTGGVLEATLRTMYYKETGKNLDLNKTDFSAVNNYENIKTARIKVNDKDINVLVVNGIENLSDAINLIEKNKGLYHFVEVMACFGGCVGGGGQPLMPLIDKQKSTIERGKSLEKKDKNSIIRFSHDNIDVKNLYNKYLGEVGSLTSKEILHTKH